MGKSAIERFEAGIAKQKETGCWLWRKHIIWNGYGQFYADGKLWRAHRWSWEFYRGKIPDGMHVDHLCRVRHCVNPDHLRIVTNAENVLCGIGWTAQNARKTHCIRGHEFTKENTLERGTEKNRWRVCITCRNSYRERRKSKLNGASPR